MSEAKQRALDVLNALYAGEAVTDEEYAALTAAIQEGPPMGDSATLYTVFLVDGGFVDAVDVCTDSLCFKGVDNLELGGLLRIAMKQDFDMVIRRECEDEEGND